jgi:protein ImuB
MLPRIVRRDGAHPSGSGAGRLPGRPASEATHLHSVEVPSAPVESPELWLGVHIPELNSPGPKDRASLELEGRGASLEPGDGASLERLATKAQRFTPRVSLVPPDGLLLEVKGSLHLFNGAIGLLQALLGECDAVGLEPAVALAPTPLAALVAARVGTLQSVGTSQPVGKPEPRAVGTPAPQPVGKPASASIGTPFIVTNQAQLIGALSALPLAPLRWPQEVMERLARMDVRTIGQVLRLPRAGFARRFGPAYLAELDRLAGRRADLRHHFQPRERFRRRRELTYELENDAAILTALAPLLADLGKFLQERQCGITELECRLRHRHAPPSICWLRLAAPVADVARLTELLGERLSALTLPEPVRSCEIRSGLPVRRVLASNPLWQPGEYGGSGGPESPELIERLRARLGHEAVYGLQMLQGHRPENAWSVREPMVVSGSQTANSSSATGLRAPNGPAAHGGFVPPWAAFRRPLWLLPVPQQLDEVDGVPRRRGALRFVGDVERIETGWWDGGDVGRDYYTAFDIYGVQLWIFRERAEPHGWFLHGVFG